MVNHRSFRCSSIPNGCTRTLSISLPELIFKQPYIYRTSGVPAEIENNFECLAELVAKQLAMIRGNQYSLLFVFRTIAPPTFDDQDPLRTCQYRTALRQSGTAQACSHSPSSSGRRRHFLNCFSSDPTSSVELLSMNSSALILFPEPL